VSLAVTQRTREVGIRTALGAERGDIVALFFASALKLAVVGLAIGLPITIAALRLLRFQVDMPGVRLSFVAGCITVGVISVASAATWIPTRRAATVDPLQALRESVGAETS
jgi:ABC-type antimicrobial peptide transport system permease subunit